MEEHQKYIRTLVRGRTRSRFTVSELRAREGRNRCFTCREYFPAICTKHHIKPVSKDGESWIENIVQICPNCHALIHWVNKKGGTVQERRDLLMGHELPMARSMKIALLSTEEVLVDEYGTICPRTKLVPEDTLTHTELYSIFNWRPDKGEEVA
jgi:hypothetical protein